LPYKATHNSLRTTYKERGTLISEFASRITVAYLPTIVISHKSTARKIFKTITYSTIYRSNGITVGYYMGITPHKSANLRTSFY
jgi:hypothetical protein